VKEGMDIENNCEEYLPYDVTMFWEFFRWERWKKGHIYLQCFPNGKLYAGQTINFNNRMKEYKKHRGSSIHHTNALKKYGFNSLLIIEMKCPEYLLDTIEIFLIEYYDLTRFGYNKTKGGKKYGQHIYDVRNRISISNKKAWSKDLQRREELILRNKIMNTPAMVSSFVSRTIDRCSGVSLSPEHCSKIGKASKQSWIDNPERRSQQALRAKESFKGIKRPEQSLRQMGHNNPGAKCVCVLGYVFPCIRSAGDRFYKELNKKNVYFVSDWLRSKKYENDAFRISWKI
jgi:hypothetical protein